MSTATQSPTPDSPRYLDYDEFIDFQVQKTRAGIKTNDLLTSLIGAAAVLLAYVLVFAVFDHWVIEGGFSRGLRIGLLGLLLVGLGAWFTWKLAIPYFRRISALYAAREIELAEPAFRSTLLTLVDLKKAGRTVAPEIRAVLERRVGLGLTHMNVEQAVDRRLLMRLSYVLLALVVATCLYAVLSPKKLSNSLWRSLLPTASVAVDTRTRIDRVQPGDTDVLARAQLPVTVELSGVMPPEVTLHYSTADRQLVDEPITLRETEDGVRQYRGVITGENGRGILQNLTYYIVAGDARSDTFRITVSQPPSATVDEVAYEYPRYMGLRDRVQIGGAIDAWEGTWVTIRATANMPVKSAMVLFSDSDDLTQKAEELPVQIESGTLLSARWQLRIRPDGTYPNFYRIQCRNDAGQTDPSPALHPIKIVPDRPPQIQLAQPTSDLERPANAVVPLLFAAEDPDFLLRSITLRLERNGESLPQSPRLYEGPPLRKSVTGTHDFDLRPLNLQPGDKLTYWLEARDNMEPFADRSGNRSNTPRLNIMITESVSAQEVQEQLAEDKAQVQERLEESQQSAERGASSEPTPAENDDAADVPPPELNRDPPAAEQQTDEPASAEETQDNSAGQGDAESQPQPGGKSSRSTGQPQEGAQDQPGEGSTTSEQGQEKGESRNGGQRGDKDVPFDDLLKRLMQREQQQSPAGNESDQAQEPQQQRQPGQREPSNPAGQNPPTADGAPSGKEENKDKQSGERKDGAENGQSSSAGDPSKGGSERDQGQGAGSGESSTGSND
ncbi:MAG: hypothetical protein KF861_12280, partial [Planctomycetaceae bacterium]|nr:hypothetical protein [Planctomycetaceae bacterium]